MEKYHDVISTTDLFYGIEKEDLRTMLNCLKPRVCSYNKNDYIVTGGEAYESLGIVLKGEATVIKENAAGNRIINTPEAREYFWRDNCTFKPIDLASNCTGTRQV